MFGEGVILLAVISDGIVPGRQNCFDVKVKKVLEVVGCEKGIKCCIIRFIAQIYLT
jgi:hypothetical protein